MKTIELKGLDTKAYTEVLDNGLEVYMIPYQNKKNYFISYATRFGSDILSWKNGEGIYRPPLGIAHFLEHKMFEAEDGVDPFTYFSKSGTDSNASTSFDYTQYICYGTKKFKDNLRYLLRFVNDPYYTDDNVEKEKGIIKEEIEMYQDMPDFKLEMGLRGLVYKNSPRKIDIAGSVDEIYKITKEDLYKCYENFYRTNNMFVLIVGNFKKEDALDIIKQELSSKKRQNLPVVTKTKEPKSVNQKELKVKANIEVPKIGIGLKVPIENLSLKELELDLYLNMLTTILFGSSSSFRQQARDEKILNSIYTEWENIEGFRTFYLMATTRKPEELIEKIKKEIQKISIDKKSFERMKKVWIANEVKMIDIIDATVNNMFDDIIKYQRIVPDKVDCIRKMKLDKLNDLIKQIDFKNISIITMKK